MRNKIVVFLLVFSFLSCFLTVNGYALSAESAVVVIAESNELLFEKNADRKMSMASTTKIMTAVIAIESGKLHDIVTVQDKMVRVEGTSMGLHTGDKLSLFNIVKGMMLLSGNDAANTVAFYISGSLNEFADLMNRKAKEIGMRNTHFVTPSGLDDDEHYTTAYDMALLASYAIKNPVFREIVSEYSGKVVYELPAVEYTYHNHNRFLTMYDGACGIKTGFTKKSGRCLITAVEKDGCITVAVTLNAPDDWNDHISLYNECLPKIKTEDFKDEFNCVINVAGGTKRCVKASVCKEIAAHTAKQSIETVLLTQKFVYAPIKKGDILGCVRVVSDGKVIGEYPVTACENIGIKDYDTQHKGLIYRIKELFRRFERWLITA